ncbi:hypothetical protein R1flu_011238 [Riccia fluitans]|uniref:Uncharacterized protein n=1 Tax=Riccia fluitans TaxID=41844 RepID=A0ABD1Z7L9_9MARC
MEIHEEDDHPLSQMTRREGGQSSILSDNLVEDCPEHSSGKSKEGDHPAPSDTIDVRMPRPPDQGTNDLEAPACKQEEGPDRPALSETINVG